MSEQDRPLSREEQHQVFDELARKKTGISGTEFAERFNKGHFHQEEYMELGMLIHMADPEHHQPHRPTRKLRRS